MAAYDAAITVLTHEQIERMVVRDAIYRRHAAALDGARGRRPRPKVKPEAMLTVWRRCCHYMGLHQTKLGHARCVLPDAAGGPARAAATQRRSPIIRGKLGQIWANANFDLAHIYHDRTGRRTRGGRRKRPWRL